MLVDSVTSSCACGGSEFVDEQQESGWVTGRPDFGAKADVC